MNSQCAFVAVGAFCSPSSFSTKARASTGHRRRLRASSLRGARMMADENSPPQSATEEQAEETSMSAQSILQQLRAESAKEAGPRSKNTGVTIDADGKSNVWAVEPTMAVDDKPQINKSTILAAAVAFIAFALLILPRLPLTNPDQL